MIDETARQLECLYGEYNRREFVRPDPLEFLYRYENPADREVVGLVASSLAYGRVLQINRSIESVLARMSPSPSRFIRDASPESLRRTFSGFRHRFTSGDEMAAMLLGVKNVVVKYGSLHACFTSALDRGAKTVTPALACFVEELSADSSGCRNSLLPSPLKGSACKRLNLFLRWMVRNDDIDPGGWYDVPASALIIPLDIHMHRVCLGLGLTRRRQANMRTALEITDSSREMVPDDPVRYDFILTRPGIWKNAGVDFPIGMDPLHSTAERTMTDED
ncbi:MAG: TIGR02757 family protein [Syntrophobacterales bacterium]|nr:MAG: TIGR02757 family protein [Syntrophobacterales bacterium]